MVAGVPLFAVGSGYLVKFSRPIVSVLVSLHLIYPDDIEQAMGGRLSSQLSVVGLVSVLALKYVILGSANCSSPLCLVVSCVAELRGCRR